MSRSARKIFRNDILNATCDIYIKLIITSQQIYSQYNIIFYSKHYEYFYLKLCIQVIFISKIFPIGVPNFAKLVTGEMRYAIKEIYVSIDLRHVYVSLYIK